MSGMNAALVRDASIAPIPGPAPDHIHQLYAARRVAPTAPRSPLGKLHRCTEAGPIHLNHAIAVAPTGGSAAAAEAVAAVAAVAVEAAAAVAAAPLIAVRIEVAIVGSASAQLHRCVTGRPPISFPVQPEHSAIARGINLDTRMILA